MLQATAAINSSKGARGTYKSLWDSEVRVFSQWGEDGILDYLLDLAEISKPRILEFGAGNFTECNSRFAAEFRNASAYIVDQREDLVPSAEALDVYWRNEIYPINDFVTPDNAKIHLRKAKNLMGGIDVLSIDVDGNDYWILESLDLTEIEILICEYNPLYGGTTACTVPRNDYFDRTAENVTWLHFGMSLLAAIQLLERFGLIFAGSNRAGNNAFFVRRNVLNKLPFDAPHVGNLNKFIDWRVRESRGQNSELTYLHGNERKDSIKHCTLWNLEKQELMEVQDILG